MSIKTEAISIEKPLQVRTSVQPVQLKYVPLPAPLPPLGDHPITMTASNGLRAPCRRCLLDASPGDKVHLIGYDPFPLDSVTPYRGTYAIFVHAHNCTPFSGAALPDSQLERLQAARAFDENHMLMASEIVNASEFEKVVGEMLADRKASYVNVYNAKAGCFAVRVERG
ncbi:uncharacterized protein FTOL_13442 [Fusarium torulosum]|uniref:DUF1203 domain-containing protein n=1 Tax=Fusarium torulosum TaxID=33205 RepID=A0AAE8SPU5_9HYPO|nr:uncharacterized protein FTOL_13442 [Fusarium torulosum]